MPGASAVPASRTRPFSTSEFSELSEFTPRTLATPARVTGCEYATMASVSMAACESFRVSHDSTYFSTSSWYTGCVYRRHPPATSRSCTPRSSVSKRARKPTSACSTSAGSTSSMSASAMVPTGSSVTNKSASRAPASWLSCNPWNTGPTFPYSSPTEVSASSPVSTSSPEPSM